MKTCPYCGATMPDDTLICPNCGRPADGAPSYAQPPYEQQPYAQQPYAQQSYTQQPYAQAPNQQYQPPYGQPYYAPAPENSALAVAALIFAFLSPVVGIILGALGLNKLQEPKNRSMCKAALILSIVRLAVAFILIFVAYLPAMSGAFS